MVRNTKGHFAFGTKVSAEDVARWEAPAAQWQTGAAFAVKRNFPSEI